MILTVVQARMRSTRLPGKVMKEVLGKPLIGYLLERLSFSKKIDKIILATSTDPSNDHLCQYVFNKGFNVYRGNEEDVLDRFYQAVQHYRPKSIVRITADCPLIDYKIVDKIIDYYQRYAFDYVSNICPPTYPHGLDTEIFSQQALAKTWEEANLPYEREHVTPYMQQSEKFKVGNVEADLPCSNERWTVDYEEDLILIKSILENLYKANSYFDMNDILEFKIKNPDLFLINMNRHTQRNRGDKIQ